jgi:hypothetical protein
MGQTGRSVDTRIKEHQRHIRLEHTDKSAVAEHWADSGHRILFHNTSIFATKTRCMCRIVREAIENKLHLNNMNRDVGFCLRKSWKPLISSGRNPRNMTPVPATRSTIRNKLSLVYCVILSVRVCSVLNPNTRRRLAFHSLPPFQSYIGASVPSNEVNWHMTDQTSRQRGRPKKTRL